MLNHLYFEVRKKEVCCEQTKKEIGKEEKVRKPTWRCGHEFSRIGSSSSGSKSSLLGGNARQILALTIDIISGISASVKIFCPDCAFT